MNDETLAKLVDLLASKTTQVDHSHQCGCCNPCIDPLASLQYSHSLARFNDTSSHTAAASQQAFVERQGAQFAQLLSLTTPFES